MRNIGILAGTRIEAGIVEQDRLLTPVDVYPVPDEAPEPLQEMPAEAVAVRLKERILAVRGEETVAGVGIGFPGIIRNGVVEESPNLPQMKGFALARAVRAELAAAGLAVPVQVLNNADAIAAGLAATRGHLEKLIRVWTVGDGVGFGRYPQSEQPWEAGHMLVSLDPKERYCGCGGVGHLEGIVGNRAMRLRFLDMEPDEVFAAAGAGDAPYSAFIRLWHRALAAASASLIHLEGPGRFFVAGPNARHVDTGLLLLFLHDMVKMSPLQGSLFEVVAAGSDLAIIGAAVNANLQ